MLPDKRDAKVTDKPKNKRAISSQKSKPSLTDMSLLRETLEKCDEAVCKQLLAKGANVNAKDEEGCTPLIWAVLAKNREVVAVLLGHGANVNSKNNQGETPIYWAAMSGDIEIANLLLEKGANVNEKDHFGISPLRSAILCNDQEMIKLLRRYGGKE